MTRPAHRRTFKPRLVAKSRSSDSRSLDVRRFNMIPAFECAVIISSAIGEPSSVLDAVKMARPCSAKIGEAALRPIFFVDGFRTNRFAAQSDINRWSACTIVYPYNFYGQTISYSARCQAAIDPYFDSTFRKVDICELFMGHL